MARLLIVTATGPDDATRASIPFHIAANGGAASGVESAVALAGDATELIKDDVASSVRGVGVPPLAELMQLCRDRGVLLHV
jgi:predicted peroxiredoxin